MEIPDDRKEQYLTGRILVAMPGMQDPRFQKAVIYMCAHDEKGAMGLVINHMVPGIELGSLMKQLKIEPAGTMGEIHAGQPVMCGGPVEGARGFILPPSGPLVLFLVTSSEFLNHAIELLQVPGKGSGSCREKARVPA